MNRLRVMYGYVLHRADFEKWSGFNSIGMASRIATVWGGLTSRDEMLSDATAWL